MKNTRRCIRTYQGITPTVGANAFIDDTALLIGDVTLGADSSIWPPLAQIVT